MSLARVGPIMRRRGMKQRGHIPCTLRLRTELGHCTEVRHLAGAGPLDTRPEEVSIELRLDDGLRFDGFNRGDDGTM